MIIELIIGFLFIIILLYLIWRQLDKPFSFEKRIQNGKSVVFVKTNVPLKRVSLSEKVGRDKLLFVRNNVEVGASVEFVYPLSQGKTTITIEDETGEHAFTL